MTVFCGAFSANGIVISAWLGAVAAADQEKMLDSSSFDRFDHFVRHFQYGMMAETNHDGLLRRIVFKAGQG